MRAVLLLLFASLLPTAALAESRPLCDALAAMGDEVARTRVARHVDFELVYEGEVL